MITINKISETKKILNSYRRKEKSIGLVPTMGALHKGHLSLISKSKEINDITVCCIYINPTQFNNKEDFENYPSTIKEDKKLLEEANCDVLFLPNSDEIYSDKATINFNFGKLESVMEGIYRPNHFSGVALIVTKLFNIINPDSAFFGQKDYQQLAIIIKLVIDLSFDIDIYSCETQREENGLAMSSRNERLTFQEREEASQLYESLLIAKKEIINKKPIASIKEEITSFYINSKIQLEYFEIADSKTLQPINDYNENSNIVICVAAFLGNVRLIDNIVL